MVLVPKNRLLRLAAAFFLALPATGSARAADTQPAADSIEAGTQQQANQLFFDALKAQSAGNKKAATRMLVQAVEYNPAFFDALIALAKLLQDEGDTDAAQEYYRKALALKPDDADTLTALGNLLALKFEFSEAEALLQRAVEKSGQSADAVMALANCYDAQGRFYDAVKQYQRALEINPHLEKAHYNIGKSFQNGGFFDLALEEYKKEIELGTNVPGIYYKMGFCAARIGSTDEAVEYFQKAIALNPKDADSYYSLGIVYAQAQNYPPAIDAFNKCVELNSLQKASAYYNIGFIHESLKEFDKALEYYGKAVEIDSTDVDSRYGMARIMAERKEYEKALGIYKQIVDLKTNKTPEKAYTSIGEMYNNLGNFVEALENLQTALHINPDYVPALVQKAVVNIKTDQIEVARGLLQRAVELDETDYLAHFWLAYCLEFKDGKRHAEGFDIDKAVLHYKICLEIQPSYSQAFENLSALLEMQEKTARGPQTAMEAEQLFAAGKRYYKNRDYSNARAQLEKALELSPGNAEITKYIELCRKEESQAAQAEQPGAEGGTTDSVRAVNTLLNNGQNFLLQEKYDAAIEQWQKILAINPDHALAKQNISKAKTQMDAQLSEIRADFEKGQSLFEKGQYQAALDELNKILAVNPQFTQGVEYVTKSQQLVLTLIKKLNEQKSAIPRELSRTNTLVLEGKYDEALAALKAIQPLDPNNSAIQDKLKSVEAMLTAEMATLRQTFDRGEKMVKEGRVADAIFEFNKILAINPQHSEGKKILEKAGRYVEDLMNQVQSAKQLVTDYLLEGENLFSQGLYLEATAKWKSVLSLDPQNELATKNIERARLELEKNRKNKEETGNYMLQASLAYQSGKTAEAVSLINKVLALDSQHEEARALLSKINASQQETERQQLVRQEKVRQYLARAHENIQQSQLDEAIRELQNLLALDPNNREAKEMMQAVLETKNRSSKTTQQRAAIESLIRSKIMILESKYFNEANR